MLLTNRFLEIFYSFLSYFPIILCDSFIAYLPSSTQKPSSWVYELICTFLVLKLYLFNFFVIVYTIKLWIFTSKLQRVATCTARLAIYFLQKKQKKLPIIYCPDHCQFAFDSNWFKIRGKIPNIAILKIIIWFYPFEWCYLFWKSNC